MLLAVVAPTAGLLIPGWCLLSRLGPDDHTDALVSVRT
jgi:hypothetical protein